MVADDVAAPDGREADRLAVTLAGHALTAIDRTGVEIAAEGIGDNLTHPQRGARRRINLEAVVGLDDLHVVALVEDPGRHVEQLEHRVHADRHVRREHHRDLLGSRGDGRLAVGREAGGADHHPAAGRAGQLEVVQGALRAGEVDQAVGQGDPRGHIAADGHAAGEVNQLAGVLADEGAVRLLEGCHQGGIGRLEDAFDEHPAHPSGCTGNGNTNFIHAILGIQD